MQKMQTSLIMLNIFTHNCGKAWSSPPISKQKKFVTLVVMLVHDFDSWYGNTFSITGPLWGESTGHRGFPSQMASNAEHFCFLCQINEYINKVSQCELHLFCNLQCRNLYFLISYISIWLSLNQCLLINNEVQRHLQNGNFTGGTKDINNLIVLEMSHSQLQPHHPGDNKLTHWGRDKMDAISQTTSSSAFSWMKMLECRLKFQWSLFLRVQLTIFQHWFR